MTISIISKYPVICNGIKTLLTDKYKINTFSSVAEFKNNIHDINSSSDILVIYTLFFNNLNDINTIIKLNNSNIKLLIIDFNQTKDFFLQISKQNISGYLLGTFLKEDLEYALHKISTGNCFFDCTPENITDASLSNNIFGTYKENTNSLLTKRELEILTQLSNGYSNFEIACNLNISENTVKKHISNIFIKINVKDRSQAIIYAFEAGLMRL